MNSIRYNPRQGGEEEAEEASHPSTTPPNLPTGAITQIKANAGGAGQVGGAGASPDRAMAGQPAEEAQVSGFIEPVPG